MQALRDGCVSHVQSVSLVSLPSVPVATTLLASSQSFSDCPESWCRTYVSWLSGGLSRRGLLEVVLSEDAGRYFAARENRNLDNCLSDGLQTRVCSPPFPDVTARSLLPCHPPSSTVPSQKNVWDESSVGAERPSFPTGSLHLEFRVEERSTNGGSSKTPHQCQPDGQLCGGSSNSARQSQPVTSTDVGISKKARHCQLVDSLVGRSSKVARQSLPVASTGDGCSNVARQSQPRSSTDCESSKDARQSQPVGLTDGGSSEDARTSQQVLPASEVGRSTAEHEVHRNNLITRPKPDPSLSFTLQKETDTPSALGGSFACTPMVVPIRGNLEQVRRFMVGDLYIGRGSKQNGLSKSPWSNSFKVAVFGRQRAIERFASQLHSDEQLKSNIWSLSGRRLICHCLENQACHADVLVTEFRRQFPSAFDRDQLGGEPPSSAVLNFLAQLRGEPEQDDGSSADEGAPSKDAGWKGQGKPMQVGVGYTAREFCDGQTLASPGRWPPNQRRYPASVPWSRASGLLMDFARRAGTTDLLAKLAVGRVETCPFDTSEIQDLRRRIIEALAECGLHLNRTPDDRSDVPVDFRLVQLLLTAAEDPEVALGDFAPGVRVGPPGARLATTASTLPREEESGVCQNRQIQRSTLLRRKWTTPSGSGTTRLSPSFQIRCCRCWKTKLRAGQVLKLTEAEAGPVFRTWWSLHSALRGRTSRTELCQPGYCSMGLTAYQSTAAPASVTKNVLPWQQT